MSTDATSPLYLHPSDHPGMQLVSSPFTGSGFASWKRSLFIALSAKNKLVFVTCKCEKPDIDSPNLPLWERCNDMVISWILNTLEKDIANSVLYNTTAAELWKELEHRFGQSNGTQLYNLHKEISSLKQGNVDISAYFTKAKCLWDEVNAIDLMPVCTCGSVEEISKKIQDQRLIQFLMGLNDSFKTVRGNILMMNPLPSLPQVHSLLVQEEQQRENTVLMTPGEVSDSMAFNVGSFRTSLQKQPTYDRIENRRPKYFCNHCKRSGHTEDRCWKKHGYPNNKDKRKVAALAHDNAPNKACEGKNEQSFPADLSPDQYGQLLKLLNQIQLQKPDQSSSANCAGPFSEEASGVW